MKGRELARYLRWIKTTRSDRVIYPAGRDWRKAGVWFSGGDVETATLAVMALWNAGMQPRFKSVGGHVAALTEGGAR